MPLNWSLVLFLQVCIGLGLPPRGQTPTAHIVAFLVFQLCVSATVRGKWLECSVVNSPIFIWKSVFADGSRPLGCL